MVREPAQPPPSFVRVESSKNEREERGGPGEREREREDEDIGAIGRESELAGGLDAHPHPFTAVA